MKILADNCIDLKALKRNLNKYDKSFILNVVSESESKKFLRQMTLLRISFGKIGQSMIGSWTRPLTIDQFEILVKIIGKEHTSDILNLEVALTENYDYLITEDHDLLSKKDEIYKIIQSNRLKKIEI